MSKYQRYMSGALERERLPEVRPIETPRFEEQVQCEYDPYEEEAEIQRELEPQGPEPYEPYEFFEPYVPYNG